MKAKDWPLPTVEIRCDYCSRYGRYSKQRFVELVGAETHITVAKNKIAADCEESVISNENLDGKCRPYYPQDWWKGRPPPQKHKRPRTG